MKWIIGAIIAFVAWKLISHILRAQQPVPKADQRKFLPRTEPVPQEAQLP